MVNVGTGDNGEIIDTVSTGWNGDSGSAEHLAKVEEK
jgi:hypothetical protein